jgi:hypothetical protein
MKLSRAYTPVDESQAWPMKLSRAYGRFTLEADVGAALRRTAVEGRSRSAPKPATVIERRGMAVKAQMHYSVGGTADRAQHRHRCLAPGSCQL